MASSDDRLPCLNKVQQLQQQQQHQLYDKHNELFCFQLAN
jgi:hypothetical protein